MQGFSFVPSFTAGEPGNDSQAIYWNPDVRINPQTHTGVITFVNNTGAKKIKIVAEGYDKRGHLTRIEKTFDQQ